VGFQAAAAAFCAESSRSLTWSNPSPHAIILAEKGEARASSAGVVAAVKVNILIVGD
jgi:hypothetical protein